MSKAILKLLALQKRQRATIGNFDRSSGSVLKASYEPRRKPRPIIEVLCYQRTKTNAELHSTAGPYFRYTAHQTGYWVVFSPPAPLLIPSVHGKLFSHLTSWRTIAESLTTLPHWLKLTQTHYVSIASSICS